MSAKTVKRNDYKWVQYVNILKRSARRIPFICSNSSRFTAPSGIDWLFVVLMEMTSMVLWQIFDTLFSAWWCSASPNINLASLIFICRATSSEIDCWPYSILDITMFVLCCVYLLSILDWWSSPLVRLRSRPSIPTDNRVCLANISPRRRPYSVCNESAVKRLTLHNDLVTLRRYTFGRLHHRPILVLLSSF